MITGNHRAKSIYLSDEGAKKAVEIISKYNLERMISIPKKKRRSKNTGHEVWTEEEYDEYMAGIYGFEFIAGYTDSGVPYGIPREQEGKDELGETKVPLDDEELPF